MGALTFLGAAGTVTGSQYLLETDHHRVLVDCGMFQGLKSLRMRNWARLPVQPASVESVVLTHAHLDHCGLLPRLVANGFGGRIVCTPGTADLCRLVLSDANVQAILVNIFAGINRCDWVAEGVVQALEKNPVNIPVVVRLAGTNVEEGRKILARSGLPIIRASTLAEAAQRAVASWRNDARGRRE